MTKINSSPDRHTFQNSSDELAEVLERLRNQDQERITDPEWQKDNMEYHLRSTQWIIDKVKGDDVYAQNLYAAMCNRDFTKNDVWPILTEKRWSCSWRHAGGIVADMREEGDYIDWYCSGIRDTRTLSESEIANLTEQEQLAYKAGQGYVGEGFVTEEIKDDLYKLGWLVIESKEDML